MKLNLCTIAIASMVLGVTARPGTNDGKTHGLAVHKARGMPVVGDLIVRRARESRDDSEDDDDDDEDEDEDSSDSGMFNSTPASRDHSWGSFEGHLLFLASLYEFRISHNFPTTIHLPCLQCVSAGFTTVF